MYKNEHDESGGCEVSVARDLAEMAAMEMLRILMEDGTSYAAAQRIMAAECEHPGDLEKRACDAVFRKLEIALCGVTYPTAHVTESEES